MSNQDRAAEVIRTWQQRHKYAMDYNPDWAAQNLAHDLHQAGLLAPDLPTPTKIEDDECCWDKTHTHVSHTTTKPAWKRKSKCLAESQHSKMKMLKSGST